MSDRQYKRDYLVIAVLLLFFVGAVAILFVIRDLRDAVDDDNDSTLCILHELNEHRHNNYEADKRTAEELGVSLTDLTPPETLPAKSEAEQACDRIFGSLP